MEADCTLCIRGHDLGVRGTEGIIARVRELGLDGLQLVCYKSYDDIPYAPGAITPERAREIGTALNLGHASPLLLGAYFNPVHSDRAKAQRCFDIFADYLRVARLRAPGGHRRGERGQHRHGGRGGPRLLEPGRPE